MTGYRQYQMAGRLLAPLALALAFGLERLWLGTLLSFGLGLWGWLNSEDPRAPDLFMLGTAAMLVLGTLVGLAPVLLLAALLGALVSWDLTRFQGRIAQAQRSAGIAEIERQHLRLLGSAVLGGTAFSGILLAARLQITFEFALALGVILVILFAETIRLLRS